MTLFLRGFVIVFLTACNVRLISRGMYAWAFVTGFGISYVWYGNSRAAQLDAKGATVYGLGAAVGTVAGAWLGGWL